jgi:hypothetical protein
MPIFRYFAVVGACLLALLFLTGSYLPPPPPQTSDFQIDKSRIRIASQVRTAPPVVIGGMENTGLGGFPVN